MRFPSLNQRDMLDEVISLVYSVSTVLHASILTINNTSETIYLLKTQLFYLCNLRIITTDQSLSLLVHLTSNIKNLVYIVCIIIASNILIAIQLVWIDQLVCIFWKFKHNKIYFKVYSIDQSTTLNWYMVMFFKLKYKYVMQLYSLFL